MGATSSQGWYLFLFMIGFTLGPAGLFALGWLPALIGFALMAVALGGFLSIKKAAGDSHVAREAPQGAQRAAKNY